MRYDYVIVGGGTAGAVLAARLSEDRDRSVLLLEAGPDYPDGPPAELLDPRAAVTRGHNWDFQAIVNEDDAAGLSGPLERVSRVLQLAARSRPVPGQSVPRLLAAGIGSATRFQYPLGKVTGGGSAINGGMALHARAEDFAAWAAAGNDEWSWENVREAIRRLDAGEGGREALPLSTTAPEDLTLCQSSFLGACLGLGHPRVDLRDGTAPGVGLIPKNVRQGRRVSAASLYLAAARGRPNLTIQAGCRVDRLLFSREGGVAATGVEALVDGRRHRWEGGEIVLAAGAVASPALLLRSGIGAAEEVRRAGVAPLLDLPGVGRNLQDHPVVSIWALPRPGACRDREPIHQVMLQLRSATSGGLCDLQLFMLSAVPTEMFPPLADVVGAETAIGISALVATPVSTGRVEIQNGDPSLNPRIFLNCVRESGDLGRMMEAVREAWRILKDDRLGAQVERVVLWNQKVIDSDALLEKMIRTSVRGVWHPAGTLRMGREGDAMAVVSQRGRLFGTRNVTVADASIIPRLPSVPTSLTCMLIGERIAAHLLGEERRAKDDE